MAGVIVIGVVVAYVAIFWFVIAKARNRGERISAIVVALLIPFWDFPIGYLTYQSHCQKDAGIHVISKTPPTNSIFMGSRGGYTPEEARKYGVNTVEYGSAGNILRVTANSSGFTRTNHQTPASAVAIERAEKERLPWNIEKTSYVAKRISDGHVIATQIYYHWQGLWWQVGSGPMFGGGSVCFGPTSEPLIAVVARGTK